MSELKRLAGYEAVDRFVRDGFLVGLGTGSTAAFAIERLGQKVRARELKDITCVATSEESHRLGLNAGLRVVNVNEGLMDGNRECDVCIDGADEIDPAGNLIKGRGGALFREKLIELDSRQFVVISDESKLVDRLGKGVVPIEIAQFGHKLTMTKISRIFPGAELTLRQQKNSGELFVSDNGNYIVDALFSQQTREKFSPQEISQKIQNIHGTLTHGYFLGFEPHVIITAKDNQNESKVKSYGSNWTFLTI